MNRTRLVAAGFAAALLVPGLSGCWSGFNAATTTQSASGDGTQVDAAGITIDSATIIAGDKDSGKATFLGTVYNPTDEPDELTAITVDGAPATIKPEPIAVAPRQAVAIQTGRTGTETEPVAAATIAGLKAKAGSYVPVTVTFSKAGEVSFEALIVPPTGFYATAAPEGTTPIPDKTNEPLEHGGEAAVAEEGAAEGAEGAATEEPAAQPTPAEKPTTEKPKKKNNQ